MGRHDAAYSSTMRKPRCFGDVDEYDDRDRTCRNCRWQSTCGVIVRSKKREDRRDDRDDRDERRERRGPGRHIDADPDPDSFVERDDASLGFFGGLAFNAALSGMRAGLVESVFAIDQIPRAPYPDPFRKVMAPKAAPPRRKREEDEEDEDE